MADIRLECVVCIEVNEDGVSEDVVVIKDGYSLCADHHDLFNNSHFTERVNTARPTR